MSIQSVSQNVKSIFSFFAPATPANALVIGCEVTFHAHYQDYRAWLIGCNEITGRAEILCDDHVLGEYRLMFVDLNRVEAVQS